MTRAPHYSVAAATALAGRMSLADRRALGLHTADESRAIAEQITHKRAVREIVNWLTLRGIVASVQRQDKKSGTREGWPDITLALPRRPIALEVKVGRDVLSDAQCDCHSRMRATGWEVYVVGGVEDAKRAVETQGEEWL